MEVRTLTEQLLFTTVRIEADLPGGIGKGTAFVFEYQHGDSRFHFLVTNKHVVADAPVGRFFFTTQDNNGQPLVGDRFDVTVRDFQDIWIGHPDANIDIVVMPLGNILRQIRNEKGQIVFFRAIPQTFIPTPEQAKDMDAIEDVTFVGYPNGIYDVKNLMPIVRRGITATPFQIDYEG